MRRCVIQLMFGCGGQAWRSTDVDSFFFFNDTATTEIYTLSLHDALPISWVGLDVAGAEDLRGWKRAGGLRVIQVAPRSEEHTSELQSQSNLVCRLLLEKKNAVATSTSGAAIRLRVGTAYAPRGECTLAYQ